ncbi:MAG: enoyl-CoA hydratase [Maricaulaceae bacterium]|jgi:enoyl-CoA hydratase/carnithine racemase
MSEHVKVADAEGVRTVTIARPEKKNALTRDMYAAMAEAITSSVGDNSVRVILFTGEGDAFTAGNDIGDFMNRPPSANEGGDGPSVNVFLQAIAEAEKPLVAAVNGMAVGVGVTMLLHCDLVYAADTAVFKAPFVDLGLVPEAGSSLLMPARIGRARAGELFLLCEKIDAQTAAEWGLVGAVFSKASLLDEAVKRARALAAKSPSSVRNTKALMRGSVDPVFARMADEGRIFAQALQSDEFREAGAAFLEKRAPDFSRFS